MSGQPACAPVATLCCFVGHPDLVPFRPSGVSATYVTALTGILVASYLWARSMALGLLGKRRLHFTAFR